MPADQISRGALAPGFDADADDLADEADDVFFIVAVVGVALNAAGRRGDSVLF